MTLTTDPDECLNCGARLHGRFCAQCGQRAAPPFPTLREMLVDAWHELTVFDDRLLLTVSALLRRPGTLTLEFLAGRRMTYVPPLRLYLVASVVYFLVAAFAPSVAEVRRTTKLPGKDNVTIDLMEPTPLSPEQQATARASIDRAPKVLQPVLLRLVDDPRGLRANMVAALPRLLFVLVPVFAAIVALFYRRPFSQHLVFALYLHAAIFMALAIRRLSYATRMTPLIVVFEFGALLFILGYSLFAFRKVYGDSWLAIVAKSVGIAALYLVAGMVGLLGAITWAALT